MEKGRDVARRESVVRNRRRQPVKKESYTEEKENGGHKARPLLVHARSLARVQSESKDFSKSSPTFVLRLLA